MLVSFGRLAALLAALLLWTWPVPAHEGHDHGAPPPPVSASIAPRADDSTEAFELVAVARAGRLTFHLDTFRGNEPVEGAEIEVDGPGGTSRARPESAGVYVLDAPWSLEPGDYALAVTVQANGAVDVLTLSLTIPAQPPAPGPASGTMSALIGNAWAEDLRGRIDRGDMSIWVLALGIFLIGLLVGRATRRRAAAVLVIGLITLPPYGPAEAAPATTRPAAAAAVGERDQAQRLPDGALFVPKPTQRILAIRTSFTEEAGFAVTVELPGRVIPDPDSSGYVQAAIAGRLMPPPGGFPRLGARIAAGDVLALVQPAINAADVTTQQQQARELEQQIALIERRLERLRQIQAVIARAQIEDAELELAGLRIRRANLDRAPREPERLVAPVSGMVAAVQAVSGQIAEPNTVIYQIVDPSRFWVEALSFEAHALAPEASGRFADGRSVRLTYRGSGLADRNQAIPVQFGVEAAPAGLRAGQLLTVLATTQDQRRGVAVPRAAVVRGNNGQPVVYEHTNAERFVPREVRVEPLDARQVLIVSGMPAGRRVVTQGAELLNQIR